jgi:hypothetical protein
MNSLSTLLFLIAAFAAGFLIAFLICRFYFFYKREKEIINEEKSVFEEFKKKYLEFEEEQKKYIDELSKQKIESYNKGFEEGYARAEMNSKILSLQIKPHWEKIEKRGFFKKTISEKIGYQYQLMVNGIPCLQPHFIIESELRISEANEDNINNIIMKVKDSIDNAVKNIGGLASVAGDIGQLKDSILKEITKKKK